MIFQLFGFWGVRVWHLLDFSVSGTLWSPISEPRGSNLVLLAAICLLLGFPLFPFGSLWLAFGSLWLSFASQLVPLGSLLASLWHLFCLPLAPRRLLERKLAVSNSLNTRFSSYETHVHAFSLTQKSDTAELRLKVAISPHDTHSLFQLNSKNRYGAIKPNSPNQATHPIDTKRRRGGSG